MERDNALESAWDCYNTASPLAGPSDDFTAGWQAALAYVREEQKPVGWFNPWNDVHGYQQVAEEFEGEPGTIPLYAAPPLKVSSEGVKWKMGSLEEVGTTERGYTIFREVNEVGGHRYWSDEIGGGVVAWDTCLVDAGTLRECLRIEEGTITESSGCVFQDLNVSPPEKE